MTVIAWDGKALAADRQVTFGYTKNKRTTKIRKYGDVLCGVTGESKYADALFKWVEDGRIKERFPSFSNDNQVMLVVIDDKDLIEYWSSTFETKYPRDTKASWGSGKELALGAMAAGADAKTAVEIACEYDLYCGGGADVVEA